MTTFKACDDCKIILVKRDYIGFYFKSVAFVTWMSSQ